MLISRLAQFAAVCAAALGLALSPIASEARAAAPTAQDFAREPALKSVQLSPDGKHIAALTSPDGENITISVWRTDALTAAPVTIGSTHMRFLAVEFIKDDRLLVAAIQPFTTGNTRMHVIKQYVTDLEGNNFRPLLEDRNSRDEQVAFYNSLRDADLIDDLPHDPQNVLVVDNRIGREGDVVRVNVYTGATQRVERGAERFFDPQSDLQGRVRAKQEVNSEGGEIYLAQWMRNPDTNAWEEHFRTKVKTREGIEIAGFTPDPNIVYVAVNQGRDKTAILAYDIRARKLLEPEFEHKLFEANRVIQTADGKVLGFGYQGETDKIFWVDEKIDALVKGARQALGLRNTTIDWIDPGSNTASRMPVADGADLHVLGRSRNSETLLIEKVGPTQPSEYYLLTADGKLSLLGKARPWFDPAALAPTRLVQYKARDGLMIPAFLTTPNEAQFGKGPYPTLIEPHGGPWARDNLEWDIAGWVQYFAARGYAVLQPQFRGSEGWGQKLWRAGDGEWGQKMQDDKDDGVKWLIDQKIADPNRVAMFGYSYGGYAALAAAIRPNGLYQCAISGAGAGDLAAIERATFENRYQREFQNPTIRGLDALDHAREASIPIFLYHGDRDQTVELKQSTDFVSRLKSAGLPYKYLEIKDMGHQFFTMTPDMVALQLTEVEKYLTTDCGPGGI